MAEIIKFPLPDPDDVSELDITPYMNAAVERIQQAAIGAILQMISDLTEEGHDSSESSIAAAIIGAQALIYAGACHAAALSKDNDLTSDLYDGDTKAPLSWPCHFAGFYNSALEDPEIVSPFLTVTSNEYPI